MKTIFALLIAISATSSANAKTFEAHLIDQGADRLAKEAAEQGDAARGAIVFYQAYLTCTKCHVSEQGKPQLGPKLSEIDRETTPAQIVESILQPSKAVKKGFRTAKVLLEDGTNQIGLFVEETEKQLIVRDPSTSELKSISKSDIEAWNFDATSVMPAGLVNQLATRQQFLDLCKYVIEIAAGGPSREAELKPAPSLYASRIAEYEKNVDHAGMIADLNQDCFKRGQAIYERLCINCHGDLEKPGSLPTSLRFGSGKFKSGNDPHGMYQTLTKGFGMMVAQSWMVPQQKYDVIHYVREAYLKEHNPSQYFGINDDYLASLPKGDSRGPAPSNIESWSRMDYGPSLVNTYEIGSDGSNFAYKGIAIRLDSGGGGVSRGSHWMIWDHDTMRVAAAWSGDGFIDWNGIHFNGRHGIHPRIVGQVHFENPTGPGWARPGTDDFEDNRLVGRDKRRYGPLDRDWAQYKGFYRHHDRTVVVYTVGDASLMESPSLETFNDLSVFNRTFAIGPRKQPLLLQVADLAVDASIQEDARSGDAASSIQFGVSDAVGQVATETSRKFEFDGATRLVVKDSSKNDSQKLETVSKDFTVTARIKTKSDGSIFTHSQEGPWIANGQSLFIRDGRLAFDTGWVGAVTSRRRVNNGKWHDVAVTYRASDGQVQLFIDGKLDGSDELKPEGKVENAVVTIGYTSTQFPSENSHFKGKIEKLNFYQRVLNNGEIGKSPENGLVASWDLGENKSGSSREIKAATGGLVATVVRGPAKPETVVTERLAASVSGDIKGMKWLASPGGRLRLQIPAGDRPIRFQLRHASLDSSDRFAAFAASCADNPIPVDLANFTKGGNSRYPEEIRTQPIVAADDGPFAVDILSHPSDNPWFCRVRLTGFDFFPGGDEAIVSAWDGNVWHVKGLNSPKDGITWRRMADGLFQPLGVKIVDGKIYVTCRDQLVVLNDLNGDGEADFYECFNNDHQVTDHFHEFAMGLQIDEKKNFYYAKSARHAKTALVPHHGTLLRVSSDGQKTDILAKGFRAANGVCLNPDGSFIVTDQEGNWNPKNRINWVREGGFYGNMWGYHDVTDTSDEAMQQPLCWITNAFDRSPSELLWVDSKKWAPLNGSLLNFSYGYGKIYVVPHEKIGDQVQGGMCAFDIPRFPTGVMRGRFHPSGQLFCCGMFAWAGNQHQPGGFYRVRYTGKPLHLPTGLEALEYGMRIKFSGELDKESATDIENYNVKTWDLKRTQRYGSDHHNEKEIEVTKVTLEPDGRTVFLSIPSIKSTWCMEIKYDLKGSKGESVKNTIHNTIHALRRRG